jgi:hypothetical protein
MDEKLAILKSHLPKAMLKALTPEAIGATPATFIDGDLIAIMDFPFKVGRESRVTKINGRLEPVDRPKKDVGSKPNNDLYLVDRGHLLNISREHFQIETREGEYYLVDRGSACGTKLQDTSLGGEDQGGSVQLNDGDVIGVGAKSTPYLFQFVSFIEYQIIKK